MARPFRGEIELDAEFIVERSDGSTTLTVMSRSGGRGTPRERNLDYNIGLRLLLERLGDNHIAITDSQVTSRHALTNFPDVADRRLEGDLDYPLNVSQFDPDDLRRAFGRAMGKTARDPALLSSGNNNKRVTFWLTGEAADNPTTLEAVLIGRQVGRSGPDQQESSTQATPPTTSGLSVADPPGPEARPTTPRTSAAAHGAGFGDAESNAIVEAAAMNAVRDHYEKDWEYEDVSRAKVGWDVDLTHRRLDRVLHVEVKGVSGSEPVVMLTANELRAARVVDDWLLVVVTNALGTPAVSEFTADRVVEAATPITFRADLRRAAPHDR